MEENNIQDPSVQGLKGLRGLPSLSRQQEINTLREKGVNIVTPHSVKSSVESLAPTGDIGYVGVNESSHDSSHGEMLPSQFQDLNDYRGHVQPWWEQIGAGIGNGLVLTGTTLVNTLLGIPVGLVTGLVQGTASGSFSEGFRGLWDNAVTQSMQALGEKAQEEIFKNHYTNDEREDPFDHIWSANFLGDKLLKNAGFMVGAALGGGAWSKLLDVGKLAMSLGAGVKGSNMAQTFAGSLISAIGEGSIEAIDNTKQWHQEQMSLLDAKYSSLLSSLEGLPYEEQTTALQKLQEEYHKDKDFIEQQRVAMGNSILGANIAILSVSNMATLGKIYTGGFTPMRQFGRLSGTLGALKSSKTVAGGIGKALLAPISEGLEEQAQSTAALAESMYYADSVDAMQRAKNDPTAQKKLSNGLVAYTEALKENLGKDSFWEEGLVGYISGAIGLPTRNIKNNTGEWQNPFESGILSEYQEYMNQKKQEDDLANLANTSYNNLKPHLDHAVRNIKFTEDQRLALENDDEFEFKNAEINQILNAFIANDLAGRGKEIKEVIKNAGKDLTEEEIESLRQSTSIYKDELGQPWESSKIQENIDKNRNKLLGTLEVYEKSKKDIDKATFGALSPEGLIEASWLNSKIHNFNTRLEGLHSSLSSNIYKPSLESISKRKKELLDVKEELIKGNKPQDVIDSIDKQIESINKAENFLSLLLSSNKAHHLIHSIGMFEDSHKSLIKDLAEKAGVDPATLAEGERGMNDVTRLIEASNKFNRRLSDIINFPEGLSQEELKRREEEEKAFQEKKIREKVNKVEQDYTSTGNAQLANSFTEDELLALLPHSNNAIPKLLEYKRNKERIKNEIKGRLEKSSVPSTDIPDILDEVEEMLDYIVDRHGLDSSPFEDEGIIQEITGHPRKGSFNPEGIKALIPFLVDESKRKANLTNSTAPTSPINNPSAPSSIPTTGTNDTPTAPPVNLGNTSLTPSSQVNTPAQPVNNTNSNNNPSNVNNTPQSSNDSTSPSPSVAPQQATPVPLPELVNNTDNDNSNTVTPNTPNTPPVQTPVTPPKVKEYTPEEIAEENNKQNATEINNVSHSVGGINEVKPSHSLFPYKAGEIDPKTSEFVGFDQTYLETLPENTPEEKKFKEAVRIIREFLDEEGGDLMLNRGWVEEGAPIYLSIERRLQEKTGFDVDSDPIIVINYLEYGEDRLIPINVMSSRTLKSPELQEIINTLVQQYKDNPNEESVISGEVTRIRTITAGKVPTGNTLHSLKEAIEDPRSTVSSPPMLAVVKNGKLQGIDKANNIVELDHNNITNYSGSSANEGRVFILIPNAKGQFTMMSVLPLRFNDIEMTLEGFINTPIANILYSTLSSGGNNVGTNFLNTLKSYFYIDPTKYSFNVRTLKNGGTTLFIGEYEFEKDSNGEFRLDGLGNKIPIYEDTPKGRFPKTRNVAIPLTAPNGNPVDKVVVFNALAKVGLPFNVDISFLNNPEYIENLINSNALHSNILYTASVDAYFGTYPLMRDSNGNIVADYSNNTRGQWVNNTPSNPSNNSTNTAPTSTPSSPQNNTPTVTSPVTTNNPTPKPNSFSEKGRTLVWEYKGVKYYKDSIGLYYVGEKEELADSGQSIFISLKELYDPKLGEGTFQSKIEEKTNTFFYRGEYWTIEQGGTEARNATLEEIGTLKNEEISRKLGDTNSQNAFNTLIEESKKIVLRGDGSAYEYKGIPHTRVSNAIDLLFGKKGFSNSNIPALEAGSEVDNLVRNLIMGHPIPKDFKLLTKEAVENITQIVNDFVSNLQAQGYTLKTDSLKVRGSLDINGNKENVAGEIDILAVDSQGNYHIIDIKTSKNFGNFDTQYNGSSRTSRQQYEYQLSMYALLMRNTYGIKVSSLSIFPLELSYAQTSGGYIVSGVSAPQNPNLNLNQGRVFLNNVGESIEKASSPAPKVIPQEHLAPKGGTVGESLSKSIFKVQPNTPIHNNTVVNILNAYTNQSHSDRGSLDLIIAELKAEEGVEVKNTRVATSEGETYVPTVGKPNTDEWYTLNLPSGRTIKARLVLSFEKIKSPFGGKFISSSLIIGVVTDDGRLLSLPSPNRASLSDLVSSTSLKHSQRIEKLTADPEDDDKVLSYLDSIYDSSPALSLPRAEVIPEIIEPSENVSPDIPASTPITETSPINNEVKEEEPVGGIKETEEETKEIEEEAVVDLDIRLENEEEEDLEKEDYERVGLMNWDDDDYDDLLRRKDDSIEYVPMDKEKELEWVRQALPQLTEGERIVFVDGLIKVANLGEEAWGKYNKGIITLSNTAAKGTLYHEAFHYVMDMQLKTGEKAIIFQEAKKRFGEFSNTELEERLAEEFREYVQLQEDTSVTGRIRKFFKNIYTKIKYWNSATPHLYKLYSDIYKGRYAFDNKQKEAKAIFNNMVDFLNHFGIDINTISSNPNIFEDFNRAINIQNEDQLVDGVVEAFVYMSRNSPKMKYYSSLFISPKSKNIKYEAKQKMMKHLKYELKKALFAKYRIGDSNSDLRGVIEETVWSNSPLDKMRAMILASFARELSDAILNKDYSFIEKKFVNLGRDSSKDSILDATKSLDENPFERDIILKMSQAGYVISGSFAVSSQGVVKRNTDNPLHDLDFIAPKGRTSRANIEADLLGLFDNLVYIRYISSPENTTHTYLTIPKGYTVKLDDNSGYSGTIYSPEGKEVGNYKGSNLNLTEKIPAKFIDTFISDTLYPNVKFNTKYGDILVANWRHSFSFKTKWGRAKDLYDFINFKPKDFQENTLDNILTNSYEKLPESTKADMLKQGISKIEYELLSEREKEYINRCYKV